MNPVVSVVVPVYNAEKYLCECIESIIGQSLSNIEIILVNDGSKDSSLEICRKYAEADKRIIIVNKDNAGSAAARNTGIDIAKGKYISFVDADDVICSAMLKTLVDTAENYNSDITICNHYQLKEGNLFLQNKHITENIVITEKTEIDKFQCKFLLKAQNDFKPYFYYAGAPWARIYRLSVINDNNVRFPENLKQGEDGIFNLYALQHSEKIVILKEAYYQYRILPVSLSHGDCEGIVSVVEEDFKEIKKFAETYKKEDILFQKGITVRIATFTYKYLATHFFTKDYLTKKGFKYVSQEIDALFAKRPYVEAYNQVEYKFLTKAQKLYVFAVKHKLYRTLYYMVKLREKHKNTKK